MNNYELHKQTHTCHDACNNPICVAVREALTAEQKANPDYIDRRLWKFNPLTGEPL